jgi:hypothetical protein
MAWQIGCEDSIDVISVAEQYAVQLLGGHSIQNPVNAGSLWIHLSTKRGFYIFDGERANIVRPTAETLVFGRQFGAQVLNHLVGADKISGDTAKGEYWAKGRGIA